jgi:ribosomal RNA-processing protein 1
MWMSDKPEVQRELAESISKLIHTHGINENAYMFIKTFYITMSREMPGVDRLR